VASCELARQFRLTLDTPLPNFAPSWRIATTDPAPCCAATRKPGERRLDVLRWGLVPHWAKGPARALRPVNARSETVSTSALFRGAYRERRCLVPVDRWYEWRKYPDRRKHASILSNASGKSSITKECSEDARPPARYFAHCFSGLAAEAQSRSEHDN
jgi:putative SOS response-associated peptidase YedK